jgi:hypothetical protein
MIHMKNLKARASIVYPFPSSRHSLELPVLEATGEISNGMRVYRRVGVTLHLPF